MADKFNIEGNLKELKLLQKEQKDLLRLLEEQAKKQGVVEKSLREQIALQKKKIKDVEKELALEQKIVDAEKASLNEFKSFAAEFRKLSPSVKEQLKTTESQKNVYNELALEAARQAEIETRTSGIVSQNAKEKKEALIAAKDGLLQQASAAQVAQDELLGISEYERQRIDLEAQRSRLGNETVDALIAASQQTEQLSKKTEILQGMNQSLPGPIQEMVGFAKSFRQAIVAGIGPLFILAGIIAAAVKSFTSLDEGAKEFRQTTGLTNSQMEGIKSQANDIVAQFSTLGVEAGDVFNTISALKSEFSDIADFGDEVVAGLTVLNANFGVSADSAAKVQGIFEQIGGLTSETATGVQLQVANMAKLAGVAPAKVFEDIAENAEIASTLFQGDVESLTKAAIEARRLGTNLKSVASTTEHLLDFQSSIGDELVAATFVGGQFNLTQARSLAAAGKTVEAQKEVLRQLQRSGDFRKQDYFTQQQLAKAAGMSVEEINKQLNAQEKLNSLSSEQRALAEQAIQQGLDISNIDKEQLASQVEQFAKQQEMQSQVEQMQNAFMGIAATIGSALTPLLQTLAPIIAFALTPIKLAANAFKTIVDYIKESIPLMAALTAGAATYFYYKNQALIADKASAAWTLIKSGYEASYNAIVTAGNLIKKRGLLSAIAEMAMRAYTSIAAIPFVGPVLGVAAAAGALALGYKYYAKAGDVISPADGKTEFQPKEGGLLELSPNDDLLAGPGIASAGGGGTTDRKMDELIAAVKQTKDVYMDGRKVTQRVGRAVENSTKNNFAFGT